VVRQKPRGFEPSTAKRGETAPAKPVVAFNLANTYYWRYTPVASKALYRRTHQRRLHPKRATVYFLNECQQEKTMKIRTLITATLFTGLAATGLSGCESEGPAEKAGKAIDEAASDVAEEASEAAEAIEKKVEE
jgi:ribosomal protein L32